MLHLLDLNMMSGTGDYSVLPSSDLTRIPAPIRKLLYNSL